MKCKRVFLSVLSVMLILASGCHAVSAESPESPEPAPQSEFALKILIDPGHQGSNVDMSAPEPNGPGSSVTKAKATTGAAGDYTRVPEYQLNLDISLMLRDELTARGYEVFMTRTDNDTAISNKERAEMASAVQADIFVRIHANSSTDHSVSGACTMAPSPSNPYVSHLSPESERLSRSILDAYCAATGFGSQGVIFADDMTGINWSSVPVTILEMGYMSNESDDNRMNDPAVRLQMVQGIANGIDAYFGIERSTGGSEEEVDIESTANVFAEQNSVPASDESLSDQGMLSPPSGSDDSAFAGNASDERITEVLQQVQSHLPQGNGNWSVYVCNLTNDTADSINNAPMQAASLIKLFIMGAVYERYDALASVYGAAALDANLSPMITVSDNTAANTLVSYLGGGDATAGMNVVNQFCRDHGYGSTSMGRLLLASNANGDNYTSVEDCGRFLKEIYDACSGLTDRSSLSHTSEMFALLQQQTRRHKIPAQIPAGVSVANKTGELDDVENDAAIIFNTGNTDLVIVFMSENLNNVGAAQASISALAYSIYYFYNG